MGSFLSRYMPRWLIRIGWPERRFGLYVRVFVFLLLVLLVLQRAGMDGITAVGWLTVVGSMTIEVVSRLFGFPGRSGEAGAGVTG